MRNVQIESLENRTLLSASPALAAATSSGAPAAASSHFTVMQSSTTDASPITIQFPRTAPANWRGHQSVTKLSAWVNLQNNGSATVPAGVHVQMVLSSTPDQTNPTPIAGAPLLAGDTTKAIKAGKKLKVTLKTTTPFTLPNAGPVYLVVSASFTDPATGQPASVTGVETINLLPPKPYPVTTPSLVHDYVGTLTTKAQKIFGVTVTHAKTHRFEVFASGQTIDSLVGFVQIDGTQETGTMTGAELSNGKFHYDLHTSSYDISFSGQADSAGTTLTGSGNANLSGLSLVKLKGTFSVTAV